MRDDSDMTNRHLVFAAITVLIVGTCSKADTVVSITVPSGMPTMEIPVEMRPTQNGRSDGVLEATTAESGEEKMLLQSTPSLFFSPSGFAMQRTFSTILPRGLGSGRVHLRAAADAESRFSMSETQTGQIQVLEGDTPVFVYNHGMQLPDRVPEQYRRSTYIHPIYDPAGNAITDDFPKDHFHHRGLSWMWPHVSVRGKVHDLWAISGVRQVFEQWLAQEVGPVCATLGVRNAWKVGADKVMDEWVWIRAFRANEFGRAIDFCLTWRALEPIQIAGRKTQNKGYGGFCLRFAPRQATTITTPNGVEAADSDLKKLPWADESGRFGRSKQFTGIAVFQHQNNPDFPAGWCLRHYGFVGVSWPGLEVITLEPGKPLTLRFRIWVHNGSAADGKVLQAYEAFAQPPTLRFVD
jgi:hypothetical protein